MERTYQICTKCIMDTTYPDIKFDKNGICNFCREYETEAKQYIYSGEEGERKLNTFIEKVKQKGRGRKYDCIIGVSGGIDSTYTAYLVKKYGLRPLAVSLDNGWDTELAGRNVEKALKKLDIDFYKYTVDWEEFRDLQLAYLKASVIDIEMLTDHAIRATLFRAAADRDIKYIILGTNVTTEGIRVPEWGHDMNDLTNLKDIYRRFGSGKLKTMPTMSLYREIFYRTVKGIKITSVLNYVPYIKEEVKEIIINELDWEDYGPKHYESIFTRFYQAYILPRKFNVDKRKAYLSNLIHSGQLTRDEAVKEILKEPYSEEDLRKDKEYCLKRFRLSEGEFESLMDLPIKNHSDFRSDIRGRSVIRFIYGMSGGSRFIDG